MNRAFGRGGTTAANTVQQAAPVVQQTAPRISNISLQTQQHIMQTKHNWDRVVSNPNDWSQINRIVSDVISKGTHVQQATEGVFHATLKVGNEMVTVTYRIINDAVNVSNAWVNR